MAKDNELAAWVADVLETVRAALAEAVGQAQIRFRLAQLLERGCGTAWSETFEERTRAIPPRLARLTLVELPDRFPDDPEVRVVVAIVRAFMGELTFDGLVTELLVAGAHDADNGPPFSRRSVDDLSATDRALPLHEKGILLRRGCDDAALAASRGADGLAQPALALFTDPPPSGGVERGCRGRRLFAGRTVDPHLLDREMGRRRPRAAPPRAGRPRRTDSQSRVRAGVRRPSAPRLHRCRYSGLGR